MQKEPNDLVNDLSNRVIGAAIEVHRTLGPGFLEGMYERALCVELELRDIPFERQASLRLRYKGREVGAGRVDLLVGGDLVVELKAVQVLAPVHRAQVIAYLRALRKRLALLINFNVLSLKDGLTRIVHS